jgi:hypothetical protein
MHANRCEPLPLFDAIGVLIFIDCGHGCQQSLWEHLMLQVPASSSRKLSDDRIAITEEVDIKVDVVDGLEHSQ